MEKPFDSRIELSLKRDKIIFAIIFCLVGLVLILTKQLLWGFGFLFVGLFFSVSKILELKKKFK